MKISKRKFSVAGLACAWAFAISATGPALATTAADQTGPPVCGLDTVMPTFVSSCYNPIIRSVREITNEASVVGKKANFANTIIPAACTLNQAVLCVNVNASLGTFRCTSVMNSGGSTSVIGVIVTLGHDTIGNLTFVDTCVQ